MDILKTVRELITALAPGVNTGMLSYSVKKSSQYAADYCNISGVEYFPIDAEIYLTEYAAADYLLENVGFSPRWEKMRKDAETSLLRFRRVRW